MHKHTAPAQLRINGGRSGGRTRKFGVVVATTVFILAGCSSDSSRSSDPAPATEQLATETTAVPAAEGAASVTEITPESTSNATEAAQPVAPGNVSGGALVNAEPLETAGGLKRWKLTFSSQLRDGTPTEVTGLAFVPDRPAPAGGWPVVSYAHPTVGFADSCAPSDNIGILETTLAGLFTAENFAVVMSDYPGLGTPGDHLFLDGPGAGNSVLDIVKAARQLDGVSLSNKTIIVGHSQGGHAALFAGEAAATRAPEMKLLGVVAGAPPSQLTTLVRGLITSPRSGYGVLVAKGLAAMNPSLNIDDVLAPEGIAVSKRLDSACSDATLDDEGTTSLFKSTELPDAWNKALAANEPGTKKFDAPVLLFHGANDDLVPVESSAVLADRMKALGMTVERTVYPGASHSSVVLAALGDITAWVKARGGAVATTSGGALSPSATPFPAANGKLRAILEQGATKPLVIAHAGGDLEAPHSTPYAFDRAIDLGADVLEMDVRLSKDDKVVVFHDPTVDRTTNAKGSVGDLTFAELQKLDSAHWFSPGCWDCRSDTAKPTPLRGVRLGTTPPPAGYTANDFAAVELSTLLAKFPTTVFDIEIKTDGPERGPAVAKALATLLLADAQPDRFVVVSFDDATLAAFRKDAPTIATSPGLGELAQYALTGAKLSPTPLLQVPPELGGLPVFTDQLRAKAAADGLAIWVWPSDSDTDTAANYEKILADKPNGIIAGRPAELRAIVDK